MAGLLILPVRLCWKVLYKPKHFQAQSPKLSETEVPLVSEYHAILWVRVFTTKHKGATSIRVATTDYNAYLRLGLEDSVAEGVEGVFFLKLSQKLTPLEIKLEKLRFRFSPNKGLKQTR